MTEHEAKILKYLQENIEISNADARERTELSAAGVRKILKKWWEKKSYRKLGKIETGDISLSNFEEINWLHGV